MRKINVREFRNSFCEIYKTKESCIITNRGKIIGTYNPSSESKYLCESKKLRGQSCIREAAYFIRATKDDLTVTGNLCNDCFRDIKIQANNDHGLKLEERML